MNKTVGIYPQGWADMCVEKAGKPYRPCNGTEGDYFMGNWCANCERDYGMSRGLPLEECDEDQVCDIIARTFGLHEDDPKYPTEWQFGKDGQPCCTAFVEVGQPIPPPRDELTADMFAEAPNE